MAKSPEDLACVQSFQNWEPTRSSSVGIPSEDTLTVWRPQPNDKKSRSTIRPLSEWKIPTTFLDRQLRSRLESVKCQEGAVILICAGIAAVIGMGLVTWWNEFWFQRKDNDDPSGSGEGEEGRLNNDSEGKKSLFKYFVYSRK